jgi:succinyl-CoA synthetase beta subunit
MKLFEHHTKRLLRDAGLPVPGGELATDPELAREMAERLGGRVVVKAAVAAGRRGKAGGVQLVDGPDAAQAAAKALIGARLAGVPVRAVYVESAVDIQQELYVSFSFGALQPQIIVSCEGGVDIEDVASTRPERLVRAEIDPARGLTPWQAAAAWEQAGVASEHVPALAALCVRLYALFVDADAVMMEINPLAVQADGSLCVVGAMVEIDDNALFRHADLESLEADISALGGETLNERERAVARASKTLPGASVRYTELDGNIGLMVSGGGAGLLQHDLMLAAGGRPSCHTDMSPTPTPDKPAALMEAILSNPNTEGLLIGFNYLQLAPCDRVAQALLMALDRCRIDTTRFPIVVRLFGPGEEEARRLLASRPDIRYLPPDASLEDGVRAIVLAVAQRQDARGGAQA